MKGTNMLFYAFAMTFACGTMTGLLFMIALIHHYEKMDAIDDAKLRHPAGKDQPLLDNIPDLIR